MVLLNQDFDCIDLSWVDRYYETGEAPLDEDLVALQFTFSEEVDGGHYDLTGEAVLTARLLVIQSGGFDTTRATTGQVDVDEIDNNE
ncbi:MAG: hypothetical protein QGG40_19580, partial [Myxococcota bacterium]|nr:hypothetical protein [Myxococcota bacterium]